MIHIHVIRAKLIYIISKSSHLLFFWNSDDNEEEDVGNGDSGGSGGSGSDDGICVCICHGMDVEAIGQHQVSFSGPQSTSSELGSLISHELINETSLAVQWIQVFSCLRLSSAEIAKS